MTAPTAVQRRAGTAADHASFVGLPAELTVDETNNRVVVHDGLTPGGHPMAKASEIAGFASAENAALTGTPTAPTAAQGANSTQIATTAFVKGEIDAVVAAAPGQLNTLDELAAALGDDANFANTVTTALAAKAPLASPALTGNPTGPTQATSDTSTRLATTAFVKAAIADAGSPDVEELTANQDFMSVVLADLYGNNLGMARGWSDAFDTQDGIDTTASTNENYDATNDLYEPTSNWSASTVLHFDAADASTTILESVSNTNTVFTVAGNAQIDTAQFKFGTSSLLLDGSGDYLNGDNSSQFMLGAGDFTIDMWVRFASLPATFYLFDFRPNGVNGAYASLYATGGQLRYYVSSADRISGSTTLTTGTWYHVAVTRSSGTTKLFLNGTQEGSSYSDATNYLAGGAGRPLIGCFYDGTLGMNGWVDELRVWKGTAAWTTTFTPPTSAYSATVNNMDLVSNAFAAPANVGESAVFLDLEYSSALTPGTDFDFAMSANNGAAYSSTGISYTLWYSSGNTKRYVLEGLNLSAQADDTVRARFRTLTNKGIKITGWRPRWSDA